MSKLKIKKVIETCIYSSNLELMKKFYTKVLLLPLVEEEKGKSCIFKVGQNMLLIFDPEKKKSFENNIPPHGAKTPPSIVHFGLEIEEKDYDYWKLVLKKNNVNIESERTWRTSSRSIYFRDPSGNLVELISKHPWPVDD